MTKHKHQARPYAEDPRRDIAKLVLGPSFALIFTLGLLAILVNLGWDYMVGSGMMSPQVETRVASPGFRDMFDKVFGAVLPVVSAWVGAVLSYYFAQSNFETGSQSAREAMAGVPLTEALRQIPVAGKMKPFQMIDAVIARESDDGKIWINPLSELREIFERGRTRAPIFAAMDARNEPFRVDSVIHESVFYRYLDRARSEGKNVAELTIENLLSDSEVARRINNSNAFVSEDATLAEAKKAMDTTPGCQDVFVTVGGRPDGAVVGWLTNVDILRHSIAGAA